MVDAGRQFANCPLPAEGRTFGCEAATDGRTPMSVYPTLPRIHSERIRGILVTWLSHTRMHQNCAYNRHAAT